MVSGTHTRDPYYSHTIPIRIPKDMGMVWEAYHKGVPCPWGSLESPLTFSHNHGSKNRVPPTVVTKKNIAMIMGERVTPQDFICTPPSSEIFFSENNGLKHAFYMAYHSIHRAVTNRLTSTHLGR